MISNGNNLTTISGDYYVGMKKNSAKNSKEFQRIDKDKNGILSGKEICNERDNELNKRNDDFKKFGVSALAFTAAGLISPLAGAIGLGLTIGTGAAMIYDYFQDYQDETNQYRKEHHLNLNS